MTREIKFRAWDGKRMSTNNMAICRRGVLIRHHGTDDKMPIFMQYINVDDKNGKHIFESDVVKTNTGRLCKVVWFSSPSFVGWDMTPIHNIPKHRPPLKNSLWDDIEVIGNVFENPELVGE